MDWTRVDDGLDDVMENQCSMLFFRFVVMTGYTVMTRHFPCVPYSKRFFK